MQIAVKSALIYLTIVGWVVGGWAYGFPVEFYTSFPGFGHAWVSPDGPFNTHLIHDAGAAFLMTGALAGLGLWRPALASPFAVGVATLVFNGLHLAYHLVHLGMYAPVDQISSVAVLSLSVVASSLLVATGAPRGSQIPRRIP